MREAVARAEQNCPIELALHIVGGKWKLMILEQLTAGACRFNQLQREIPLVTPRMLARQLRELAADRMIHRTVYPDVPPRVEYSLTDLGRSLVPLLDELRSWGQLYARRYAALAEPDTGRR